MKGRLQSGSMFAVIATNKVIGFPPGKIPSRSPKKVPETPRSHLVGLVNEVCTAGRRIRPRGDRQVAQFLAKPPEKDRRVPRRRDRPSRLSIALRVRFATLITWTGQMPLHVTSSRGTRLPPRCAPRIPPRSWIAYAATPSGPTAHRGVFRRPVRGHTQPPSRRRVRAVCAHTMPTGVGRGTPRPAVSTGLRLEAAR
jgi:hypothetical protein